MAEERDIAVSALLTQTQKDNLRDAALGPMVALANPLDYHTYIWRDTEAMTRAWAAMMSPEQALTMAIVDYPHTDATDWDCATQAALNCVALTGRPFAVTATLPELDARGCCVAPHGRGRCSICRDCTKPLAVDRSRGITSKSAAESEPVLVAVRTLIADRGADRSRSQEQALADFGVRIPQKRRSMPAVMRRTGAVCQADGPFCRQRRRSGA